MKYLLLQLLFFPGSFFASSYPGFSDRAFKDSLRNSYKPSKDVGLSCGCSRSKGLHRCNRKLPEILVSTSNMSEFVATRQNCVYKKPAIPRLVLPVMFMILPYSKNLGRNREHA
jgi:hypothetical protein